MERAVEGGAAALADSVDSHSFNLKGGDIVMLLLTLTVVLRIINYHRVHLPPSIMMSFGSIICTGVLLILSYIPTLHIGAALDRLRLFLMDFPELVLNYMLGFLLFAAAIEVDLRALSRIKTTVVALSVFTTFISTMLVSILTYLLMQRIAPMDFSWCLLFGAIVSPTDPVAVISILNQKPDLVPSSTRYFILGESLFNDAIGVVLYLVFVETVQKPDMAKFEVWGLFLKGFGKECLTGIAIGFVLAWCAYSAIMHVNETLLEITITFVLVGNINMLCNFFHASIPLASVTAGLFIGNYGVMYAMSKETIEMFHELWKFLDETLNSILFLLIGAADLFWHPLDIGWLRCSIIVVCTVAISLFARFVSVATPLLFIIFVEWLTGYRLRHRSVRYRGGTIAVLTWAGMRGGISIALALGVPDAFVKHAVPGHMTYGQQIFLMTFTLVVFSICIQGLLFEKVITMIQALSYEYLEHGGLSTFKSCMSLNMDNPELDTLLPTREDNDQWARNDSWNDSELFESNAELDPAERSTDFEDEAQNPIGTPMGRKILLGDSSSNLMSPSRVPPPGHGHNRFESTTFQGLDPLKPVPGFTDVLGNLKKSGSQYLSQFLPGLSSRQRPRSHLRRASTMPIGPMLDDRQNGTSQRNASPPNSPAPSTYRPGAGRPPRSEPRNAQARRRENGSSPRRNSGAQRDYGSMATSSPSEDNIDHQHAQ